MCSRWLRAVPVLDGAPPFEGDNVASILAKILFGEALRVSAVWPEVPEDLDALVAQMLAKEPRRGERRSQPGGGAGGA